MVPYVKYFLAKNPEFGVPKEPFKQPSFEEYEYIKGSEPTKISCSYEEYVEREKARHEREPSELELRKEVIVEEADIKTTENSELFVRWIDPKEMWSAK